MEESTSDSLFPISKSEENRIETGSSLRNVLEQINGAVNKPGNLKNKVGLDGKISGQLLNPQKDSVAVREVSDVLKKAGYYDSYNDGTDKTPMQMLYIVARLAALDANSGRGSVFDQGTPEGRVMYVLKGVLDSGEWWQGSGAPRTTHPESWVNQFSGKTRELFSKLSREAETLVGGLVEFPEDYDRMNAAEKQVYLAAKNERQQRFIGQRSELVKAKIDELLDSQDPKTAVANFLQGNNSVQVPQ